eukprot:TRINITY_DN29164_c0_g1_i1.p1 TRINITY_DN29164_c0_g1~~TRINITY_DN29164_c0_g1_i1.p1  ORF type:complete len:116 (+),score=5.30 TRINITY_DN29164_c0_g1_i1:49-396(+)
MWTFAATEAAVGAQQEVALWYERSAAVRPHEVEFQSSRLRPEDRLGSESTATTSIGGPTEAGMYWWEWTRRRPVAPRLAAERAPSPPPRCHILTKVHSNGEGRKGKHQTELRVVV